jgi:hypothetical protein
MTKYILLALGGFVLGFAIGREHPAHRYQPFPTGGYVFDSATGKACSPFRQSVTDMIPACGNE